MTARPDPALRPWAVLGLLATLLGVGAAVHASVTGNWLWLAASVVVLVGVRRSTTLTVAGAIGAVVVAAWPALVAAGVSLLSQVGLQIWLRWRRPHPLRQPALVAAVSAVPPALRRYLETLGGGRVDTVTLLTAAVRDEPTRWPYGANTATQVKGSEGGLVENTVWTVVAAEAALVAAQRPDQVMPVDVQLLAAVGVLLPHSHAQIALKTVRASGQVALELAGLTSRQLGRMLIDAAKKPGGELLMARVEMDVRAGSANGELLDDQQWRRLGAPGRQVEH
jgi:hypothetical protein